VFYVENALINSLFGLLCWPAVFMALPGAFFHPFQSGPADLGTPDFTLRRAAAFDACLARLDDGSYRALDAAQDSHVHLAPLPFPVPVYGLAVEPKRHGDEQRAWEILGKLAAEDPCLRIEHVAATNETVLYGLGELHLRIVLERLREVYRFEVQTRPPRIAYRETVTAPAEGHYRHKKQSGGAGQFAEVFLRIEPLARGAGFDFADDIRGGAIPGQFIPAVEKGVREVLAYGAIAGYPVVDVRVVVYDGKNHSVDSKDIAFATAGRKAFMAAIREARPAVLEPIVQIEIAVPEHSVGDVTSDLSLRRGLVTGTSGLEAGTVAIGGQVPEAELADYQSRLNAMTSGQGATPSRCRTTRPCRRPSNRR
jgi:elongation factor G